jgi:hypothetical protein
VYRSLGRALEEVLRKVIKQGARRALDAHMDGKV